MTGFGPRCLLRLQGVHPDLVRVATAALSSSPLPFIISEGVRSIDRQAHLFVAGKSWTLRSKHLTGHAVDIVALVDGSVNWQFDNYLIISKAWKEQAFVLGIPIFWGGDWLSKRDGCHFELVNRD